MKNNALLSILALLLAVAAVAGVFLFRPTNTQVVERVVQEKLGAFPGPEINFPYLSVNGVEKFYFSSKLNQASTTLCSFKLPSATTTIDNLVGTITTATSSALYLEWGVSKLPDATTTKLSYTTLAANVKTTIVASTTLQDGVNDPYILPPNQYLVFKYGQSLGTTNTLVGACRAELTGLGI